MGQEASKGSFEFRYVPEADCFRRKLLLIQPPSAVSKDEGLTRVLRSVSVQCVTWDSQTILPEQWMSLLGNQLYAVYFVPYRSHRMSSGDEVLVLPTAAEVEERATYAFEKVRNASPDAKLAIVVWDNAEDGYDEEEVPEPEPAPEVSEEPAAAEVPTGEEDEAEGNDEGAADHASSDDEEAKKKPSEAALLEDRNRATLAAVSRLAKEYAFNRKLITVSSSKEKFQLGCLLSACITPQDIARPLCSLLYQLRDACGASEAFLVDSISFYPLLSTLDDDPATLGHSLHETLWVFATTVRRIMTTLDSDIHLVSMPCGKDMQLFFGWACRPYAYLMLLAPSHKHHGPTQMMIEKNLEAVSMHFYNVINNTTLRRQYTPMTQ